MEGRYREAITEASTILTEAMFEDADELIENGRQLDACEPLGLCCLDELFLQQPVERRPVVTFNTLLRPIEVESVYLYNRESGEGRRHMREAFGVVGRRYSDALERALTDFGIEKSFGRAENSSRSTTDGRSDEPPFCV